MLKLPIPEKGLGEDVLKVIAELSKEEPKLGDRKSLGPMMSRPNPTLVKAFIEFLDRNLNDYVRFKTSWRLAQEALSMLCELFNGRKCDGIITYGGSESNLTGLYILRELGVKHLLVPKSAHTSVFKAAKILQMKTLVFDVDSKLRGDVNSALRKLREVNNVGSVGLVLTVGNTETGAVDPVKDFHEEMPDVPIHVDGAYGAILIPFLEGLGRKYPEFDFRVESVFSISVDGHKNLLTPIPSGALLLKDKSLLELIAFKATYFLSEGKQYSLLWSRSAGSAATLWASLMYYGKEGLSKMFADLMRLTEYAYDRLTSEGFEVVEPELPILCFKHDRLSYLKIWSKLNELGWYVYSCPSLEGIKITIMPHVSEEVIDALIQDLKKIVNQ